MPPYLAIPHYHLSKLPVTTKIALTCFSTTLLTAIAFVVFVYFAERTHYSNRGVQENFAGNEWAQEKGEVVPVERAKPTARQIYDVIHPHSFMMAVIYFILCHMMEMTYAARSFKIALYLGGFLSMIGVMFAPLLVWSNIALAPVVIPSVVLMGLSFSIMTALPVIQMWVARDEKK